MVSDRNPIARPATATRTATAALLALVLLAPLTAFAPAASAEPATLTLATPSSEVTYTHNSTLTVAGTVYPTNCTVHVNGHAADVNGETGEFRYTLTLEPGNNTLRVVACAEHDSESVLERLIVLQESSVDLTIDWPPREFVTNQTSVVVSGHTDPNATVTVNGANVSVNATSGAFETTVALNDSHERTENVIVVVASDGLGNHSTVTLVVIVDTTAPVIELLLGEDLAHAIETGTNITWTEVAINGRVDHPHTHVQVNGHNATVEELAFGAHVSLSQGENTIVVTATDDAGNRAQVTLTIWVDSVAPTIDLDLDANVSAAIEAGTAIHATTLQVRGSTDSADAVIVVNEHGANQTGLNFTATVELHDGQNVILIVAEDHAGNRREVRLTLLVDLSNPGLAVTLSAGAREAIAEGRPTTNASVEARVQSNASNVSFYLNGELMSEWSGSMNVSITLSEGENTLLFEATEGELVSREEFHITLDTVAPSLYAQLNGTTEANGTHTAHQRLLLVNGTAEAGAHVHLCTTGPEANDTTWCHGVDVSDHGDFHGTVELDSEVENTVTVVATDRAGNRNELSFTVVFAAPTFDSNTSLTVHIGGAHEGSFIAGSELVFEVGSEVDLPDDANVSWYIDGELVGTGARLGDVVLEEGNHTIEVRVSAGGEVATASRDIHVEPEAVLPAGQSGWGLLPALLGFGLVAVGTAVGSTDRGRYFLMGALLGSVFTRLKKPAPLDHFVRGRLFQLVSDEPGIHYGELRRRANLSNGVAAHHLRVLETAGILRTVEDGTRRRFYPTDQPMDPETYGLSDSDRAVLDKVTETPGISESELSEKVGRSLSTVSRSVERMAAMGYVTATRQGRTVSVFPRAGNEAPMGAQPLPADEA